MPNYLEELNEEQKEAVLHREGALLIIAGAGAGKTKTLTSRILHLVKNGVAPESILAVTFTNKAAAEMRDRVRGLLEKEGIMLGYHHEPFVATFHSLGVRILREEHETLGIPRHFTILDQSDSQSFIKTALKAKNLDPKQYEPKKFRDIISRQKGEGITMETFREQNANSGYFPRLVADVWFEYEKMLKNEGAFDFDDLLVKTLELFRKNLKVREKYQDLWNYIHIDEYQDTNRVQYEITKMLAEKNGNICVVGDVDQNIYSWRGANIRNMLHFEKDFSNAKTILLEQNYRSTQNILTAANDVIQKNKMRVPKNLFTKNGDGEKIFLYEAYDESAEANFIAEKIQELARSGEQYGDIAVLFRANFQSRAIEEAMLNAEIPYQVLGVKFFDRKEVKDTLAFLRAALNPKSMVDLKRIINVPPRGIGETTLKKIFAGQKDSLPPAMKKKIADFEATLSRIAEKALVLKPSETIKYILKETGMENSFGGPASAKGYGVAKEEEEERLENLGELITLATRYDAFPPEEAVHRLLEDAALASDQDSIAHKNKENLVRLMTIHASKGLEFGNVFISGLEDGLFPHKSMDGNETGEHKEEERRLFYVALTRAKRRLFLSYASVRTIFGSRQVNAPSEFLNDINDDLVEREVDSGKGIGKIIYF